MTGKDGRIELKRGQWYGWQMWPGYAKRPYASPILIEEVTPLKSGQGQLRLVFLNALYAQGVQGFDLTLRVLARRETYLMASLDGYNPPRDVVIAEMTRPWLEALCPALAAQMRNPRYGPTPAETQHFLSDHFGGADRHREAHS